VPSIRALEVRYALNSGAKADIADSPSRANSRLMRCSKLRLLVDHLVCAGEQRRGKIEAEHFSDLEVDDQLVFGRRIAMRALQTALND
jgi:hypothetical protein